MFPQPVLFTCFRVDVFEEVDWQSPVPGTTVEVLIIIKCNLPSYAWEASIPATALLTKANGILPSSAPDQVVNLPYEYPGCGMCTLSGHGP